MISKKNLSSKFRRKWNFSRWGLDYFINFSEAKSAKFLLRNRKISKVSLPCGRYAPMVRTSKWIWRARSGTAVKIVLIRIISTIVVSIAKPVRFHTNCRIFTLHMTLRAGYILISTSYFRLIRSTVVLAIVDTITFLTFRNTSIIFAGEFTGSTIFVFTI